ncbi:hypothetical protein HYS49_03890 [Candidatus Woesearchaeota archaeon]|nr:hypothetical protein [Candidatus Woesearchaeota archaeon]
MTNYSRRDVLKNGFLALGAACFPFACGSGEKITLRGTVREENYTPGEDRGCNGVLQSRYNFIVDTDVYGRKVIEVTTEGLIDGGATKESIDAILEPGLIVEIHGVDREDTARASFRVGANDISISRLQE